MTKRQRKLLKLVRFKLYIYCPWYYTSFKFFRPLFQKFRMPDLAERESRG